MKRPAEPKIKVYVQKRRAQKVVKEVYLRNDVSCSSQLCQKCQAQHDTYTRILPASAAGQLQYLIPDTNVFYHCIDIMEQFSVFTNVIVLQTALDELRNKSLPLYNRLRKLVKDGDKRFYVFHNEFHSETYIERRDSETVNDRNDRAIRTAARWYVSHLEDAVRASKKTLPNVVLLTDDRLNAEKARKDQITCQTVSQYLKSFPNAEELQDLVTLQYDNASRSQEKFYDDYLNEVAVAEALKKGTMFSGVFNVTSHNYLEATVHIPKYEKPVHILGRHNFNRAIQGDIVVVEVLPESEWRSPSDKIVAQEENAEQEDPEDDSTAPEFDIGATSTKMMAIPTAKVVAITKHNWRPYVGHLDMSGDRATITSRSTQTFFFIASDRRIPRIKIRTRQGAELRGQKILVSLDRWVTTSKYAEGHFVRSLGAQESKDAETEALLLEWDVQYRPFPKAVIDCLPSEGGDWKVPQDTADPGWIKREDLRDLLVCSIDPPGCQDIDDALHARQLPNGNIEVGVHIADVSSFVKASTAMDEEAASRGTTVYMVDKRIDMLPALLGTDLCSLMPYVERFAFSTIWEMNEAGQINNVRFTKSVIKSKEAFSYEKAQQRIDDKSAKDDLTKGMRLLLKLSKKLRAARLAAGALNLASPEVKIQMDSETSDPIDVQTKVAHATNSLVEEFMLLANISVAQRIYQAYPETAMLRRHGAPPATNFEGLQDMLRQIRNLELRVDSSKALADSLDACIDPKDPFFNTLVRIMATRCMLSAEYFSSNQFPQDEFRHYGLASDIYTHFTSPIRRYADIIAHRQLSSAIGFDPVHPSLENSTRLVEVCRNINYRHRMAQMAGRASVEYYVGQSLRDKVVTEKGYVMKVFENGIVVFIAQFGLEGVIKFDQERQFDAAQYTITLPTRRIRVFDQLNVEISTILEYGKRKVVMTLL